ncbi:MAG: class I SAM-dependent methyltransferase [Victivallaceae bacterium]
MNPCEYTLLDSGDGKKLERFGEIVLLRPGPCALWDPLYHYSTRSDIDAEFVRNGEAGVWKTIKKELKEWTFEMFDVRFRLKLTPFGHIGFFPEHSRFWGDVRNVVTPKDNILNLFAYTGGISLVSVMSGGRVTHVDASKSAIRWARVNFDLNGFRDHDVFWILDDVMVFIERELRRGKKYEVIIADPPTYGRGVNGETFKIEKDLKRLIRNGALLLSENAKLFLITSHTPGHTPLMLERLLRDYMSETLLNEGKVESGEVSLGCDANRLPVGVYVKWTR